MLGLQLEINVILYRQTHSKKDDHLYQNLVIVDIASDKQTAWMAAGPGNEAAIYGHHLFTVYHSGGSYAY